ncbi:SCO2521 family protein [Streptomyces sp. NBC_01476]|uniref:SCO2521 family protein n=1 Tax=Streptomyces sp. NBC_01476 TaxID=2903881 RepID=UPI002E30EC73|nr:SCO2521 family protein [Streptomyces sp. NBC_01476]
MAAHGGRDEDAEPVLVCGEVRTSLLQNSQALPARTAADLLRLRAGERVRLSERPNPYALSPDVLTGVDCLLPTASGAKVRAVGTVAGRAALTEGRLLQTNAFFEATAAGPDQRRPWGHYLARPGVVEPFGRLQAQDVARGCLTGVQRPGELDLGAIAERLLSKVGRHRALDQRAPFKAQRTRLRWVALRAPDSEGPSITAFTLAENGLRTVELRLPGGIGTAAAAGLCEDLALHDWLLTTLVRMVERSRLGSVDGRQAVSALRPAVDHLLHLWMPTARVDQILSPLWEVLEREPGFSRQWQILVQRIRDQLALQAIPLHGQP